MKQTYFLIPLALLSGLISCKDKPVNQHKTTQDRITAYLEKCSRAVKKEVTAKNNVDNKKCFEVLNKSKKYEEDMEITSSHIAAQEDHFSVTIKDIRGMKYDDDVLLGVD